MTDEGYIKPDDKYIKDMFFRKPGLPILMVEMPDGKKFPTGTPSIRKHIRKVHPIRSLWTKPAFHISDRWI